MTAPKFIKFHHPEIEGVVKQPDPSVVVSGNPEQTSWLYVNNEATATKSGQWDCKAGSFLADYAGIIEFCEILEGSARIVDLDTNAVHEVSAGDAFVMEPGLNTRWEIDTYVRKHFVITEVR